MKSPPVASLPVKTDGKFLILGNKLVESWMQWSNRMFSLSLSHSFANGVEFSSDSKCDSRAVDHLEALGLDMLRSIFTAFFEESSSQWKDLVDKLEKDGNAKLANFLRTEDRGVVLGALAKASAKASMAATKEFEAATKKFEAATKKLTMLAEKLDTMATQDDAKVKARTDGAVNQGNSTNEEEKKVEDKWFRVGLRQADLYDQYDYEGLPNDMSHKEEIYGSTKASQRSNDSQLQAADGQSPVSFINYNGPSGDGDDSGASTTSSLEFSLSTVPSHSSNDQSAGMPSGDTTSE